MKKRLLLLLLPLMTLASCDDGLSVSSSSSLVSTSTSTSTSSAKSEEEIVTEALVAARGDISLSGSSRKVREFQNPYYAISDTDFTSEDSIAITDKAYSLVSKREDAEEASPKRTVYKDDLGRACEQYLTYKNEVALTPILDNLGNETLFEPNYGNPFDDISFQDLVKDGENYKLSGDKAQLFVYKLTGEKVQGDVLLAIDEEGVQSVSGADLTGEEYYVSTSSYTKLDITFSFDYELSDAVAIEDSVKPSDLTNADLATALSGLKDGFRFNNLMDGEVSMSSYFTKDGILYQMMAPGATEQMYFDMYFVPNDEDTMDLYWCNMDEETGECFWEANDYEMTEMYGEKVSYEYLASDIANLSAAVFEPKEGEENVYVPVEAAKDHIAENIIPGIYDAIGLTSYDEIRYSVSSVELTLVDAHTINFDYVATIQTSGATARVSASLQFADIGTAKLPYTPVLPTAGE